MANKGNYVNVQLTEYHNNGMDGVDGSNNGGANTTENLTKQPRNGGFLRKTLTGLSGFSKTKRVRDPRLRIHWRYLAAAIGLFVAAILFAVGHDLYYLRLNGKLADSDNGSASDFLSEIGSLTQGGGGEQTWALRFGTALAFLNKTCLTTIVALVTAQQVWYTLRRTAMTVDGIDGMFDILNNPLALFASWDVIGNAKIVVLVALLSWCLPLASVVTPATLSVGTQPLTQTATKSVPALNLSDTNQWATFEGFGYIQAAHFSIATLFSNVYSSAAIGGGAGGSGGNDGIVQIAAPFPNSTYDQTLYGPSYKCMSLAEALALNDGKGITPTWLIDNPKGTANTTFKTFEDVFYGELNVPRPGNASSTNAAMIYSAVAPSYLFNTILISAAGVNPLWDNATTNDTAATGSNLVCQLYNTSYDVTLEFVDGVQTVVPRKVELLEPQDWVASCGSSAMSNLNSITYYSTAPPYNSSYGNCNQATAAFWVTHLLFKYLLGATLHVAADGGVTFQGSGVFNTASAPSSATLPLLQSPLIHCADFYNNTMLQQSDMVVGSPTAIRPGRCRNGTLAAAIEDLSRNFTYSLLAFDGYTTPEPPTINAAVTYSESRLFFVYSRSTLWAAYATALGSTLLAMLLVGVRALLHNGVVSSTSFSSTLLTTRSDQLREAILNSSDGSTTYRRSVGAQPVDPGIGQLRLRFGHIVEQQRDGTRVEYAGFGLEGRVRPWREEDEWI
ncbi:hypothetical protein Sste5346_009099 [Sporothrix stenoceras]|uniref:Formylmethionine deformylase-like protein n=1 Tax=Sporothrix stenoceras TaxID=5173 RepID=A0ABR3YLB9_9PEZI